MKTSIIFFVFLLCIKSEIVYPQVLTDYGVKVAATSSTYDWKVSYSGQISPDLRRLSGLNISVFAEWFDNPYLTAVTQLEYSQRGTAEANQVPTSNNTITEIIAKNRVDYLSVPIFAKFHPIRIFINPYILVGPRVDFLLDKQLQDIGLKNLVYDHLKKAVLGYSMALGIESVSFSEVRVNIEARYNFDFINSFHNDGIELHNNSYDLWFGVTL